MLPHSTALLLIDCQKAWDEPYWGERNNPGAEACLARLLGAFRAAKRPVVHVRHASKDPNSPLHPGEPGHAFKPEAEPREGEPVFVKQAHSAFSDTGLSALLREGEIDRLVIAGFVTPWCISSTARSASDLGFKVAVVHDACAAFDLEDPGGQLLSAAEVHRAALTELHGAFAMVLGTDDLLAMV